MPTREQIQKPRIIKPGLLLVLGIQWTGRACWPRSYKAICFFAPHPYHAYTDLIPATDEGKPVDYSQIITIEPGKRSGKPCIRGTRMTVYDVLGYMAAGMSQQEILADFPSLTETDIRACLAFAADGEHAFEIIST
jgi:uncharacterized protein (DUF433 family)